MVASHSRSAVCACPTVGRWSHSGLAEAGSAHTGARRWSLDHRRFHPPGFCHDYCHIMAIIMEIMGCNQGRQRRPQLSPSTVSSTAVATDDTGLLACCDDYFVQACRHAVTITSFRCRALQLQRWRCQEALGALLGKAHRSSRLGRVSAARAHLGHRGVRAHARAAGQGPPETGRQRQDNSDVCGFCATVCAISQFRWVCLICTVVCVTLHFLYFTARTAPLLLTGTL